MTEPPQRPDPTADGPDTILVCPECDSAQIQSRVGGARSPGSRGSWYCNACSTAFDDALDRERRKGSGAPRRGPAADILGACSEDDD